MLLGEVVDQLLDQHGLAHARAAEQADLAALRVGREQVDHLDARLEHLGRRSEVLDARRLLVDRASLDVIGKVLTEVDQLTEQVEDAPERHLADGNGDRGAGVDHLGTAGQAVGGVHRDRAHAVVAEVLLDLAHEHALLRARADPLCLLLAVRLGARDRDRVVDLGQAVGEDRLDHDALDLLDAPDVAAALLGRVRLGCGAGHLFSLFLFSQSLSQVLVQLRRSAESLGPRHDLHDLLGDLGLAGSVHLQRVVGDDFAGVLGGASHRRHLRAEEARGGLDERAVDRDLDVVGYEPAQDRLGVGLVVDERARACV